MLHRDSQCWLSESITVLTCRKGEKAVFIFVIRETITFKEEKGQSYDTHVKNGSLNAGT